MEDANLREELATLEAEEAKVSAERRHLHRQIDFGFASETTRAREREISDERRQLHKRIDEIREILHLPVGPGSAGSATPVDREPAQVLEREFRLGASPGSDDLTGDEP